MMSNLVNVEPDPKTHPCDMPVEVVFEKLTDEITAAAVPAGAGAHAPMKELSNSACIVGVDESDEIGTLPAQEPAHAAPRGDHQRRARRRPQGHRRGRHLHRGPALARHARRGARHHAALRRRHHRGRLLVHHHGRPRGGRAAPRALRRGRHLPRRDRAAPAWASRARRDTALTGQFEIPYGFGARADLLRHDHHAPHARVRHHARAVGAGGGVHARSGRRSIPRRATASRSRSPTCSSSRPVVLSVQPAEHLPRHRRRRRGGADARRPREGLREEAGLRARRRRGAPST